MGLLEILGGVGLTLFGVRFLRKGLDRLFGSRLVHWVIRLTDSPLRAFFGGICAGTFAPSSTGLSLFAAQMLSHGQISARRMLAVLLGASIGLTIMVQLLAFKVTDYAGLFIIVGTLAFTYLQRELLRGLGQCLLSLGFVFLAIGMIGQGAREMTASPEWFELFRIIQNHPWVLFFAVAFLAVVMQSSTAAIGLGLGLASSGLLTAEGMVPWVIGTNVGLGFTSLIAGWGRLEGRRMGAANVLAKGLAALPLMLVPVWGTTLFEAIPGSLLRQTAMAHTAFNLIVGLGALPLLGPLTRLAAWLFPDPEKPLRPRESFLDKAVLDTPSLALARATRETLRMCDHVEMMLRRAWESHQARNEALARRVQREDDAVDELNHALKEYLSAIVDTRHSRDMHWQLVLLTYSNEMEAIADLVDKFICDLVIKQEREGIDLLAEDERDLREVFRVVMTQFEAVEGFLTTRDANEAAGFISGKEPFNDWCRSLQHLHYNRLHLMSKEASATYLDLLNTFRRISSHLFSIGYAVERKGLGGKWEHEAGTLLTEETAEAGVVRPPPGGGIDGAA